MNLSRSGLDVCEIRHLENVETTWGSGKIYQIFCYFNAKTSVQITFLANLTGILVFLTHDHHVPCKKWSFIFKKVPYLKKNLSFLAQNRWFFCCSVKAICGNDAAIKFNVRSPIWVGGGSIVLPTWICWRFTFHHLPLTPPSGRRD